MERRLPSERNKNENAHEGAEPRAAGEESNGEEADSRLFLGDIQVGRGH